MYRDLNARMTKPLLRFWQTHPRRIVRAIGRWRGERLRGELFAVALGDFFTHDMLQFASGGIA